MDTVLFTILAFGIGALAVYMFYVLWSSTDGFGRVLAVLGALGFELLIIEYAIERWETIAAFLVIYISSVLYAMCAAERERLTPLEIVPPGGTRLLTGLTKIF